MKKPSCHQPLNQGTSGASAPFPGYESAFRDLEPMIGRLLDLSRVQEALLYSRGDLDETATFTGDLKEALWFITGELRGTAGQLEQRWTDLHNAGVDHSEERS